MSTGRKVANTKDLREGGLAKVDVNGKPIVITKVGGKIYAMDAVCSHEGGPLEEGTLEGYELKCPWHSAVFDFRNAKVSEQTVWATDLQSYPVTVDANTGDVLVNPDPNAPPIQNAGSVQQEPKGEPAQAELSLTGKKILADTDVTTFHFSK